jgi:outer membrane protein OmpA-like peptidoglycan-associated protein
MRAVAVGLGLLCCVVAGVALAQGGAPELNLLAFSSGALIERASSDYGGGWNPMGLIDEDPARGWATEKDARVPFEVVISLPERSEIRRFEFDTASVESPDRSAKDIDILMSDESATAGFKPVLSVKLKPDADAQKFAPRAPGVGRWVKLVVKSTHGSTEYAEIMDVRGYGIELTSTPLPNVSGTYDSPQFGQFHLSQNGAQLSGCYEHKGGLLQGGLEAHLMRLQWSEEDSGKGPALMVMTRDGKGFKGFWRRDDETGWAGDWDLRKVSNQIGACPHWKPQGAGSNVIATSLAKEGRVRLYGINFDTDSDKLRADAKPTLDQLVSALKENAGWKIVVEGHTDASGLPDKNRDLSNRRATSVRAFLATAGIAAARVETKGFGPDQPIAPNETSIGRAQNRRVEIVRQ